VLCILGTRPEAVKLAPVILRLREDEARERGGRVRVCVTGQHREMLDQVLALFSFAPEFDLDLMSPGQTLAGLTARAVEGLDGVLDRARPDCVLVQGDTTTAMVGALTAFYRRIPVGHVEAGLRTGNPFLPFPEEANRRMISSLATWHFAPTERARRALLREGVRDDAVWVTGNTAIDALLWVVRRTEAEVPALGGEGSPMLLLTVHRRESFGKPLERVCRAVRDVCRRNPQVRVLCPVHMNPRVRGPVRALLGNVAQVTLCPPLDYRRFVLAMQQAHAILTDSGGVQEEAPALSKPVLVLRDVTERPEAVEAGAALTVGTEPERILRETERLLHDAGHYRRMAAAPNPFGDGRAAERIVDALTDQLARRRSMAA
jgi:UDP-N-acetylglucosamine 2-epimerase